MIDLYFRASTSEDLADWLTTSVVRAIIGDLRARDENGLILVPTVLRDIPGNVDVKTWAPNQVDEIRGRYESGTFVPGTKDAKAWVHLRLSGAAETSDFSGPPGEGDFDRWEHSKLVTLISAAGKPRTHRGVTTFEILNGPGKGVSIFRGSEMGSIVFHRFAGGSSH